MASSAGEVPATAPVTTLHHVDNTTSAASESFSQHRIKRNRIQLSCTHCRRSKLRCGREKPCSQCVSKGRASTCVYPGPVTLKRPAAGIQSRLKHLESLVKGAMPRSPSTRPEDSTTNSHIPSRDSFPYLRVPIEVSGICATAPIHTKDAMPNSSGQVVLGPNESTYVGATHWAAMLDDIEVVRTYFEEVEEESAPSDESVRPDLSLVFAFQTPVTREELLNVLPERQIVDRLICRYFNSNSPALHIIHKPTFQRNYRKFWADPYGTPISWLALIYSIMCLATFAALGAGEANADTRGTPMEMIRIYRRCCAQCLVLSNYVQPGPYTLETFLLYFEGEFVLSKGDQMNCYLIVGVAVRLAMRMGLHRDSNNIGGNISPYQCEYRRRIWHLLVQMDLLVSFHIGLPSMVQAIKSDTPVPSNLRDQDLDEDTIEMPPSRPETEPTGMSYTLAKGRIARVFGKIAEQANLLAPPSYDDVMALDWELQQAFTAVPTFLRIIRMEFSITDFPQIIIQRFSLAVLFQKSRCVLHREYLIRDKENMEFSYSTEAAINASMELLIIQNEVHEAIQPGGPLCKDSWIISSLSMHDLLLAGMIVYLSLIRESEEVALRAGALRFPNVQQKEMIKALERSHRIWAETTSMSVDSRKACDVMGNVMKRLYLIFQRDGVDTTSYAEPNEAAGYGDKKSTSPLTLNGMFPQLPSCIIRPSQNLAVQPTEQVAELAPEPTSLMGVSALDLGHLGGGGYQGPDDVTPSLDLAVQFDGDNMSMPMDPLGAMFDPSINFDWDVFDNHVRQPHLNNQAVSGIPLQDFNFEEDYNYSYDI